MLRLKNYILSSYLRGHHCFAKVLFNQRLFGTLAVYLKLFAYLPKVNSKLFLFDFSDIKQGKFYKETIIKEQKAYVYPPKRNQGEKYVRSISSPISSFNINKALVFPGTHMIKVDEQLYLDSFNPIVQDKYNHIRYDDNSILVHDERRMIIKMAPSVRKLDRAIHLLDSGGHNYFHFMIELLPKLLLLKEKDSSYKNWPLIVSAAYRKNDNFRELLRLAGFQRLFFMEENECLEVEELVYVNKLWNMPFNLKKGVFDLGDLLYHPYLFELYDRFIEDIEKDLSQKKDGPERIFLTRCNTVNRRYNDLEIEALARQYDFEIVDTGRMSFAEQFQLFRNAAMIAGPTGASWTNLVFAARNAKALCWMSERWGDFPAFSTLAALRGVDLEYIIIPGKGEKDPHHNYYLDPLHFESRLKALIEKGEGSSVKESTT